MLIFVNHEPSLFQDSLSSGSGRRVHPCTSTKIPRNQLCSYRSTLSHVHSDRIQLATLVIAYLLAHLSLLLLQAGDIETNPGPQTPGMPVHCLACIFECKSVYKTVSTFICGIIITVQSDHQLQYTLSIENHAQFLKFLEIHIAALKMQVLYVTYIIVVAVVLRCCRRKYCACMYDTIGQEMQVKCMWDIESVLYVPC